MRTRESEEMYLETILILRNKNGFVRSLDIAEGLGYAKSSVSRAVNLLQKRNFIIIEPDGEIIFTPEGEKRATDIYNRHKILTDFLTGLGVTREIAETDACRIEHVISSETLEVIKNKVRPEKK